jgi:hypothetical protein
VISSDLDRSVVPFGKSSNPRRGIFPTLAVGVAPRD